MTRFTDRCAEKRASLLDDVVDHCTRLLTEMGVPENGASVIASDLADHLSNVWGGQNFNFPKGYARMLSKRDIELYEKFTGYNHGELASEYGISERAVYKVLTRMRKRLKDNARNHPQLFET
jgi:Mor family transcriptional regulator